MPTSIGRTLLWGGLYVLGLLSLMTPLSILTAHFILVPLLVTFVISDTKRFVILFAAILAILLLFLGHLGMFLALVSLFYLVPTIAMGRQYRLNTSAEAAVISGMIGFIGVLLVVLLLTYASGYSITDGFTDYIRSDAGLMSMLTNVFGSEANVDYAIALMIDMIPTMIIVIAIYTTILAHWIGRKILSRMGMPIGKLRPMKEWKLPRSLVFYYLIVLVLDMFVAMEPGSTLSVLLINSIPLLTYAFALQAVGFLFFVAQAKGWNRALPIAAIVLLPFPGASQLLAWLGVLDVAFPLRSRWFGKGE